MHFRVNHARDRFEGRHDFGRILGCQPFGIDVHPSLFDLYHRTGTVKLMLQHAGGITGDIFI